MLAIRPAYARLAAAYPGLRVRTGPPPPDGTWLPASDLAAGGHALHAFLAGDAARPDVAATLALHRYLWPACLLFTVPWFLHGRVPRLPVGTVAFRPEGGHFAVRPREFACLTRDRSAARLPGAAPVPTPQALRQELRGALAEHLGPVLAAFGPHVRRGPAALRRLAADEIAESLWYVARLLGEEDRAVAELTALLPREARFRAGSGPGEPVTRSRLACCLYYTVSPSHTCAGCPRARAGGEIRGPARTA